MEERIIAAIDMVVVIIALVAGLIGTTRSTGTNWKETRKTTAIVEMEKNVGDLEVYSCT